MTASGPAPRFVDEVVDDLEKKYKSPTPDSIGLKAAIFEGLLHRYLLLAVGLNACAIGWLVLHRLESLPRAVIAGGALAAALACALLAWPSWGNDRLTRALLSGATLAFLLIAASIPGELVTLGLIVVLAVAITALAAVGRLPEGAAAIFALYVPFVMGLVRLGRPSDAHADDSMFAMTMVFVPMIAVFTWRRLKLAASCALAGAVVTGMQLLSQGSGKATLTALFALLVIGGLIYEMRIRWQRGSALRESLRLGIFVALVYLLIAGIAAWLDLGPGALWLAAVLICTYEIPRALRDTESLPFRIFWASASIMLALLTSEDWPWSTRALGLLALAAVVQIASLRANSRYLSNVAVLYAVAVAAWTVVLGAERYERNVLVVSMLTFAALALLSRRPAFAPAVSLPPTPVGPISLLRRGLLVAGGVLLRVPLVGWVFFLLKTGFQWLRYFRSSTDPLGVDDLLFAGAQVYGVMFSMRQVEFLLAAYGVAVDDRLLAASFIAAVWGGSLLAYGVWRGDIYSRMIGVSLIIVPAVVQAVRASDDDRFFASLAVGVGLVVWVSSWAVLRFSGSHAEDGDLAAATMGDTESATGDTRAAVADPPSGRIGERG